MDLITYDNMRQRNIRFNGRRKSYLIFSGKMDTVVCESDACPVGEHYRADSPKLCDRRSIVREGKGKCEELGR